MNFRVESSDVQPWVPRGVEVDEIAGSAWISLVALSFRKGKAFGVPIPAQHRYAQINLRTYVKRWSPSGWRHGVTFLREVVPRPALAAAARVFFNEPYLAKPTQLHTRPSRQGLGLKYCWGESMGNELGGVVARRKALPPESSIEAALSYRLRSYTAQKDGSTAELCLQHPHWRVAEVSSPVLRLDEMALYPEPLHPVLSAKPDHCFFAEGSPVRLCRIRLLP